MLDYNLCDIARFVLVWQKIENIFELNPVLKTVLNSHILSQGNIETEPFYLKTVLNRVTYSVQETLNGGECSVPLTSLYQII